MSYTPTTPSPPMGALPQIYETAYTSHSVPPNQTPQPYNYPPQFQAYQSTTDKPQITQPPLPQQSMSFRPGGNKNANNLPFGADNMRSWSTGLFDCFHDPERGNVLVLNIRFNTALMRAVD